MTPDGKNVMHAQLKIGDSMVMLGGEFPPDCLAPKSRGGSSVFLHIYLADVDATFDRAVTTKPFASNRSVASSRFNRLSSMMRIFLPVINLLRRPPFHRSTRPAVPIR